MIWKKEARIKVPEGAVPPDPWTRDNGAKLQLDHVVARNRKGEVASRAGDIVWDLSLYQTHWNTKRLYFDYWCSNANREIVESEITAQRLARVREMQLVMCELMYGDCDVETSVTGLGVYLNTLRKIASFAEQIECDVLDVFGRSELLDQYIEQIHGYDSINLRRILNSLYAQTTVGLAFPVARTKLWGELCRRANEYQNNSKQHAPLPTSIYSQLIIKLGAELTLIETHLDGLVSALRGAIAAYREAGAKQLPGTWESDAADLLYKSQIRDLFERYGRTTDLMGLSGLVAHVYLVCKLQIHTFTGMRDKEALHLPFHCMKTEGRNGRKYALIEGVTTKLNGGRKRRTKWVTTEEDGFRAIRIAQALTSVIYESLNAQPSNSDMDKDLYPLFVSTEYLPWFDRHEFDKSGANGFMVPGNLKLYRFELLANRILPVIKEEDILELEDIEPFRDWHDEKDFAIGQRWPLKPHQLRRSLALYARASGCVRLSSLRRQLQHISNDMSAYYGNGCAFAKNFFMEDPEGFKKHIVLEWQNTEEEAELLAFVWDVLQSDEPLYGGAGNFYAVQKRKGTLMTRDQAQKAIKDGTLAYKEGPLGACVKPGPCEKRMGLSLINAACATKNCRNLIGKHSKIIQVIKAKRNMLERMDQDTITYRAELEELADLEKVEARWRPQEGSVLPSKGEGHA